MTTRPRRPEAWRLDDPELVAVEADPLEALDPPPDEAPEAVEEIVRPRKRGVGFGRITAVAAGGLVSLALALALDGLIRGLFARADLLGFLGLALAALLAVGVVAIVARELIGLFRLKRIARLRLRAESAAADNARAAAVAVAGDLVALYRDRPEAAKGRRLVAAHSREIMDGRDLLVLAERDLIVPLDAIAMKRISASASRVSVVTAVSPRAVVDVVYVLVEGLRLIRALSGLYGGRPGALGLLRLTRAVVGHLAVTGTLAVGDTLLQQIVGGGIAGRISARLGEGVVNGLMTARIGLSAMDICRPLPFLEARRPRLADLAGKLIRSQENDAIGRH